MALKFYILISLIGLLLVLGMSWLFIIYYKKAVKEKPAELQDNDIYGTKKLEESNSTDANYNLQTNNSTEIKAENKKDINLS